MMNRKGTRKKNTQTKDVEHEAPPNRACPGPSQFLLPSRKMPRASCTSPRSPDTAKETSPNDALRLQNKLPRICQCVKKDVTSGPGRGEVGPISAYAKVIGAITLFMSSHSSVRT